MARKTNLSDQEVSALLMATPVDVCDWVQQGKLHARIDIGGHRHFGIDDVHRFAREKSLSLSRPGHEKQRILIIEEDRRVSRALVSLFDISSDTLEVQVVPNAFDAGQKMHTFRPDVVLLDFSMSSHDGFEICRRIKADPASQGVRVIAMTRFRDIELKQRILMAGAEACIPKPLNSQEIFSAMGLTFELRAQPDNLQ